MPARVALGQADRVLDGLGAGVREEHLLEVSAGPVAIRLLDDQPCGLAALVVGERRGHHAQRVGLVLDRLDHLRVLMPEVHVHEHAREVDPGRAVLVPELRAERTGDHRRDRARPAPTTSGTRGRGRWRRRRRAAQMDAGVWLTVSTVVICRIVIVVPALRRRWSSTVGSRRVTRPWHIDVTYSGCPTADSAVSTTSLR